MTPPPTPNTRFLLDYENHSIGTRPLGNHLRVPNYKNSRELPSFIVFNDSSPIVSVKSFFLFRLTVFHGYLPMDFSLF